MNRHYKNLRVITATGPIHEAKEAIRYCYDRGYSVTTSGPMPMANKYDTSRYKVVAEKELIDAAE